MNLNRLRQVAVKALLRAEAAPAQQETQNGAHWLVLGLAIAASAGFALRLGQDVSWDVRNYHYYSGYAFLHKPLGYDFAPAQVQSFFNPLLHVPTYLMLSYLPAKVVTALLGAVQGLNFYLVFRISLRLFQRWNHPLRYLISLGNAAAGFYGTVEIMELGATFGDTLVSIPVLTGMLLIFRLLQSREAADRHPHSLLLASGAFIGIACALKLTIIIHVVALILAMPFALMGMRRRARSLAVFYTGLAIGFCAAYGIWGLYLYREYQNPAFPYFNSIFRSPYYDLANTMDARFLPRNWRESFFYPFYFAHRNQLVNELKFRDVRLAMGYVALVLLAGSSVYRLIRRARGTQSPDRQDSSSLWLLALFLAISYITWQQLFSIYRYVAVLELLVPTFIALVLANWFQKKTVVLACSLALNYSIGNSVIQIDFGRQPFQRDFWKVQVPRIDGLDRSQVLMVGQEASSYIVPSFPASTRFIRISSNFLYPGRNENLDGKIRQMLAPYDITHTLVYVSGAAEFDLAGRTIPYYGLTLDEGSCRQLTSPFGNRGYLCGVAAAPKPLVPTPAPVLEEGKKPPSFSIAPHFREEANAPLEITVPEVAVPELDSECRGGGSHLLRQTWQQRWRHFGDPEQ